MINKYNRTINNKSEKMSFWPTFTDLLSTVLMVVILILFSSESISGSVEKDLANKINISVEKNLSENNINAFVDPQTGQITFGENTMFDVDSYDLKPEAKEMLKILIPKYVEALYSDYGEYISKVVIEGHTDDVGSYMYNLDLSQKRAYSVAEYLVGEEIGDYKYKDELLKDIIAIGRSEAELIKNGEEVDRTASRRVEIKYELTIDE